MPTQSKQNRCPWATTELYNAYHDEEWGVPVRDDRLHFEFIILEGAQAGLSWITILKKRDCYRELYENFDVEKVARFSEKCIESMLTNPGIVRNRLKVESSVTNAQAFIKIQKEFASFDEYIWRFVDGAPTVNAWETLADIPAETPASVAMSKDLKKRGFRFVGPTICYAYMQAAGLVNDHLTTCPRRAELIA